MLHTWKNQFNKKNLFLDHYNPTLFICSQWQHTRKPHLLYLIYRWVVTIYFSVSWTISIIDIPNLNQSAISRSKWLIYLTNWGYTMCFLQSCLSTAMISGYFLTSATVESGTTTPTDTIPSLKPYKIYWISNVMATDIAFGITVLYWSVIYNDKEMPLNTMNIIVHGLNSLVMLLDLWVLAHPIRILHFYLPVLFGLLYIAFSIIYYFAGGTDKKEQIYIYTILNWSRPGKTVLVCFGAIIFIIIIHFFTYGMYRLRKALSSKVSAKINAQEMVMLPLSGTVGLNIPVTSGSGVV